MKKMFNDDNNEIIGATKHDVHGMDGHFWKNKPFLKTSNSLKYATTTRGSKFERFNVVLGFGT